MIFVEMASVSMEFLPLVPPAQKAAKLVPQIQFVEHAKRVSILTLQLAKLVCPTARIVQMQMLVLVVKSASSMQAQHQHLSAKLVLLDVLNALTRLPVPLAKKVTILQELQRSVHYAFEAAQNARMLLLALTQQKVST